jgi:peptidoglycan-associated lipoprotein
MMNKIIWPMLLVLALSGCSSTGDKEATVEDRTASKPVTTSPASAAATSGKTGEAGKAASGGAETTALEGAGVKGSSLDGKQIGESGSYAGDPRKDPASPLAKREIFFDFDSYVVKDEYRPMLEAHAAYLMAHRDARMVLQGNTDERGSREYNLALGQKRAEAVRKALAVIGVNDAQMEAVSFGEEKLRNEAHTEEAYAEDRRVDVVYADE